jgi:hypothetical protein
MARYPEKQKRPPEQVGQPKRELTDLIKHFPELRYQVAASIVVTMLQPTPRCTRGMGARLGSDCSKSSLRWAGNHPITRVPARRKNPERKSSRLVGPQGYEGTGEAHH